jgi:hypothetical protein
VGAANEKNYFLNLIRPCHNIIRNSSIGNLLKKANTNRDFILGNLREAEEEFRQPIKSIQENADYDEGEFYVALQHLYNHIWIKNDGRSHITRNAPDKHNERTVEKKSSLC